ncbi:hypothetical protein RQP46_000935 [Phenoliferia psychrophenolica]
MLAFHALSFVASLSSVALSQTTGALVTNGNVPGLLDKAGCGAGGSPGIQTSPNSPTVTAVCTCVDTPDVAPDSTSVDLDALLDVCLVRRAKRVVAASATSAARSALVLAAYSSFSAAGSTAGGSQHTSATTQPGGVTRFRRGHARKKDAPVGVRSIHPDELDFATLEDPDEVFRLFGVRDVRGLEKRAAEAAAAKVAELRTMVGERYRDLLSAADSIVRMRAASSKLVDGLDRVDSVVSNLRAGGDIGTSSKRGGALTSRRLSSQPLEAQRTLASPPTLSLTINLLLTLPSHVHSLLETSAFLPAARLEGVGRVVYRELSTFTYDEEDDEGEEGGLTTAFPIIERQWETIGSMGPGIVRRAIAELSQWDTSPTITAETLAAILMLENATLPSCLTILFDARTRSLSAILDAPPHKASKSGKPTHEIESVLERLGEVLGLVLRTVEAATAIFGANPSPSPSTAPAAPGLLLQLLQEIEHPTATSPTDSSPKLQPILSTLPNYAVLQRHLPSSILSFSPFLSITSPSNTLSPTDAASQIDAWLQAETARIVAGVQAWVSDLRGGPVGANLQRLLEAAIEDRLAAVYNAHLSAVINRVQPCLTSLLAALPTSDADLDPAKFLFDAPLAFPPPSHYALPSRLAHLSDPFEPFYDKLMKRVEGRSPLIDKGLGELEAHARDLREDLEGWLGGVGPEHVEVIARDRLREQYVHSAKKTLDGVYEALCAVLEDVAPEPTPSLFFGHFIFMLSRSKTFARDLLLGSAPVPRSQETEILKEWQERLESLQASSLTAWRTKAISDAIREISDSTANLTSAQGGYSASTTSPVPTQPSPGVLSAVRTLVLAARKVGPHRTHADPSIVRSLLAQFELECLPLSRELVRTAKELPKDERARVAMQAAWDTAFLHRLWTRAVDPWEDVQDDLWQLVRLLLFPPGWCKR